MEPTTSKNLLILISFLLSSFSTHSSTFTFVNKCHYTVWPGILSGAGSPPLESTGFQLSTGSSRSFQAPSGWSGRFWGRTRCHFDSNNRGSCSTGDCGSGELQCNGAGATPPATLAEFTLGGSGGKDFYDVSLVDGYNLPMLVESTGGGGGGCVATGCAADLNKGCPAELRVGDGEACRSACEAFGKPEYCCSGAFGNPNTCRPSAYSQMFKSACPRSYSYAYDDATSTFTCVGGDYVITFCPASGPSLKSSTDSSSDPKPGSGSSSSSNSKPYPPRTTTAAAATMGDNDAWLASLAMGDSTTITTKISVTATTTSVLLAFLLL